MGILDSFVIENRQEVETTISGLEDGLDFADALHHLSYKDGEAMTSFDDRRFARRIKRLGITPRIIAPK